jgi:hypothetical protein
MHAIEAIGRLTGARNSRSAFLLAAGFGSTLHLMMEVRLLLFQVLWFTQIMISSIGVGDLAY